MKDSIHHQKGRQISILPNLCSSHYLVVLVQQTPLHIAISHRHVNTVKALIQAGSSLVVQDKTGVRYRQHHNT